MSLYAEGTDVSAERSKAEIERTLKGYGATAFLYGRNERGVLIQFSAHNRIVRFVVPLPDPDDKRFSKTPTGLRRGDEATRRAYEAEVRRRWRSLANAIKAKLDAVATGIVDFEREFLAHIVLPDDSTVGQWFQPQLEQVYASGAMPAMLPALEGSLPALQSPPRGDRP